MSLSLELEKLTPKKIATLPTSLLQNLIKNMNREISRRLEKNPISALNEWTQEHPERFVTFDFMKINNDWMCVARALDEYDRLYETVGVHRFGLKAKQNLKKEVALDLYLEVSQKVDNKSETL